jgi:hypothetical protein
MNDCPWHGPTCDGVVYGKPIDPLHPSWLTHRHGGCVMDLTVPAIRARTIADGTIWSGPPGAIDAAIADLLAGRVAWPDPATINTDWREYVAALREEAERAT